MDKIFYFKGLIYNYNQFINITKTLFIFTYIKYKNTFGLTKIDNDIGWGCAIRSTQMLYSMFLRYLITKKEIVNIIYKENGNLSIQSLSVDHFRLVD